MREITATAVVSLLALPLASASWAQPDPQAGFSDQSQSAGIGGVRSNFGWMYGGAVGDFDRDGWQDIFYPMCGSGPDRLYINNKDGTFTDRAAEWGVSITAQTAGAAVGDYDGDGWLDLYVTSRGPVGATQGGHHRLYRNVGGTHFVEVAEQAGVDTTTPGFSQIDAFSPAWGDYDLDGDLDLAVASHAGANRLCRNEGDGSFTDVTSILEFRQDITRTYGFCPRFVDLNDDRYPELVWIADFGTSHYFINDTQGGFIEATAASGTALAGTEMGMTVADFNDDGRFDFYVTTINANKLYLNQGGHTFSNAAPDANAVNTGWGWASAAVDFNHDGLMDILAASMSSGHFALLNVASEPAAPLFQSVGAQIGFVSNEDGFGLSTFDYDNDGDQDAVLFPRGRLTLLRNDLDHTDRHWLRVFCETSGSPGLAPDGIGTVIEVTCGERTWLGRIDGGSNYMSQSELSAHFGLGANPTIDQIRVRWNDGTETLLHDVPADQTITVSPPTASPCDVDGSGTVDSGDFFVFVAAFVAGEPLADFDESGIVDSSDFFAFIAGFVGGC